MSQLSSSDCVCVSLLTVDPISFTNSRGRSVHEILKENNNFHEIYSQLLASYIFYRGKLQIIRVLFDSERLLSMQAS